MKKTNTIIFLLGFLLLWGCTNNKKSTEPLLTVPFTAVHLNDSFWAPKIKTNRKVFIPLAFKKSEETGRMDNFAVAGKLIEKEQQGDFPFNDTDVYKILEGASYALALQPDKELETYPDSLIMLIGAAQENDGYLYTCITNKCEHLNRWYGKGHCNKLKSHEIFNCGHLYEAAIANYQATGERSLLDIAFKWENVVSKKLYITEGIGYRAQDKGFGPNYQLSKNYKNQSYSFKCQFERNLFVWYS